MQELQQPAQHASWVRLQVAGWLYVAVPASTTDLAFPPSLLLPVSFVCLSPWRIA